MVTFVPPCENLTHGGFFDRFFISRVMILLNRKGSVYMKLIRYAKAGYILTAAALVVLGVILAVWPEMSMLIIGYAVGAILLVCGIVRILGYFSKDLFSLAFQFDLALGIFTECYSFGNEYQLFYTIRYIRKR